MDQMPLGRSLVSARIENLDDLLGLRKGRVDESNVRRVEVSDALVDTSVFGLLMPMRMITQLGLERVRTWVPRTIFGQVPLRTYRAVVLTIQGRDCVMDVSGIADHLPIIVGQLPLEAMDWVIDRKGQRLIGNPEHGGEDMVDLF